MMNVTSNSIDDKQEKQSEANKWHETERSELAPIGIGFDGRYYRYKQYRYDLLSDALHYARFDRAQPAYRTEDDIPPQWIAPETPTAEQQKQMADLGVSFDGKYYRYAGYRYDQFTDAAHYAYALLKR
jgi:hypothetical protein